MTERMTLGDVFARRAAEIKAELARQDDWEATPEGKAWRADRDAHEARMRAAEERFAADNPPDPHADGVAAALAGAPREAPDDLSDDDADLWLAGYDSTGSDDDSVL
jgi:hypothetical protein